MAHEKELGNFLFLKRALRETFFSPPKNFIRNFFLKVWLKNFKFLTQTFLCRSICSRYFRLRRRKKGERRAAFVRVSIPFHEWPMKKELGNFLFLKRALSRNFLFAAKNFIRNFFKSLAQNFKFLTQTFLLPLNL